MRYELKILASQLLYPAVWVVILGALCLLFAHAPFLPKDITPAATPVALAFYEAPTPTGNSVGFGTGQKVIIPMHNTKTPTEIPVTPTSKVEASVGFKNSLSYVKAKGISARAGLHWFEKDWTEQFYSDLDHLITVSPDELKPQSERLKSDFLIGIELMSEDTIQKALDSITRMEEQIR